MSYRSPLGRARGLGSAKEGTHHFWVQRVTAVALIPLTLWFVFSLARLPSVDYDVVHWWVAAPSVAIALVLFLGAFIAIAIHTYWPSRAAELHAASRLPLEDDQIITPRQTER